MAKSIDTITLKEHEKIVAKKDAIITELANIVDAFREKYHDFLQEATPVDENARKIINRKSVGDIAWPPRQINRKGKD